MASRIQIRLNRGESVDQAFILDQPDTAVDGGRESYIQVDASLDPVEQDALLDRAKQALYYLRSK